MAAGREEGGVAVVITTYNHAHFLAAAIESALGQTVKPAEVVVIDDGSKDRPEHVTARYPDVRIVHQSNAGLAAARNRGLSETSAPFILFLDADDQLRPLAIESGMASLARNEAAAFTYGAYRIVKASSGEIIDVQFRPSPEKAFAKFLHQNPIGMHGTVLYRRDPITRAGGFQEHLPACEDYDLYLRLSRDHPIACHPEICADYYHHGQNMSADPVFMLKTALAVLKAYRSDARARGLLAEYYGGLADWKRYYVSVWAGLTRRSPTLALAKAPSLAIQAPSQMVRRIAGFLRGRRADEG
jgi:glycosyltransferase involved in cell wall biosynthesis